MSTRRWMLCLAVLSSGALRPEATRAQDSTWHIIGQVRPRVELRDGYRKLPTKSTDAVFLLTQRSRLGARYSSDSRLAFTLILQDVRTWGDETSTTGDYSADNVDLYRGFVDMKPNSQWTFRIGRQGLGYDEDRILGDGDWGQQGRSHDAVRVMFDNGRMAFHAAWAHNEVGDPLVWAPYPYTSTYQDLALLWFHARRVHESISLLCLYDDHDRDVLAQYSSDDLPTDRWTIGGRLEGASGKVHSRIEGYYQFGHRVFFSAHRVVKAYLLAIELDRSFGSCNVMLWYDYLSGDDKPYDHELTAFDPPYATTHRFYGWADYFVDIPKDTYEHGLEDLALKLRTPIAGDAILDAQFHYFWLAKAKRGFNGGKESHLGFEMDLGATVPLLKYTQLQGGYSLLAPSNFIKKYTGGNSSGHWFWMMLDVNVK